MSRRLSQLLSGLQSKLDAATQSHGAPSSYSSQPNGAQPPYGAPNSYDPPAPYGPPPQGAPGPYGGPHNHAPPAPYAPPGHPPAYGTPYPNESPFPQAPPTPHDPPSHSGPSDPHDPFDLNLNPDTLEPYKPPPGPPPHSSSSNHYAAPYGQPHSHAAPSPHGPPAQVPTPYGPPSQYPPPPPTGSPHPPYSHPGQQPPPGPHGHNPSGSPAPYGTQNSYLPHAQPPPVPSGPSAFPSRVTIRSGGPSGGSTTIHDASNTNMPPLYTFRTSSSKPQVVMLHPDGHTELGQASISSTTMNMKLSLRGRSMPMKQNEMGDTFTVESPRGRFKWSIDQMKGCLEEMRDEQGTVVARYRGGDLPGVGERGIEICVPCDQEMFELVMLSTMAGRALNKKNVKIGMKILKHAMMG